VTQEKLTPVEVTSVVIAVVLAVVVVNVAALPKWQGVPIVVGVALLMRGLIEVLRRRRVVAVEPGEPSR
jgi:hypothetical protein